MYVMYVCVISFLAISHITIRHDVRWGYFGKCLPVWVSNFLYEEKNNIAAKEANNIIIIRVYVILGID